MKKTKLTQKVKKIEAAQPVLKRLLPKKQNKQTNKQTNTQTNYLVHFIIWTLFSVMKKKKKAKNMFLINIKISLIFHLVKF